MGRSLSRFFCNFRRMSSFWAIEHHYIILKLFYTGWNSLCKQDNHVLATKHTHTPQILLYLNWWKRTFIQIFNSYLDADCYVNTQGTDGHRQSLRKDQTQTHTFQMYLIKKLVLIRHNKVSMSENASLRSQMNAHFINNLCVRHAWMPMSLSHCVSTKMMSIIVLICKKGIFFIVLHTKFDKKHTFIRKIQLCDEIYCVGGLFVVTRDYRSM